MFSCLNMKKCEGDNDQNQTLFTKNGAVLLEELIAFCNGRSNPIRHFTEKELLIATNYYERSQLIANCGELSLYKGSLEDRSIFVKKYTKYIRFQLGDPKYSRFQLGDPYKDIVIGSQMSVHNNVLKVLGCCLETEKPTVVYEFSSTKTLSQCIFDPNVEPLPWKCRLKIAIDLANVISYLHTAFPRPVIHRDISSSNIILNQNNVPKLFDFGLCISIPEGESHVEDVVKARDVPFIAREYRTEGYITEKADVYLYGLLLVELFSGKRARGLVLDHINVLDVKKLFTENIENLFAENLEILIDQRIKTEVIEVEQLQDLAALIIRCISDDEEKRPTMIEVAKELKRIYTFLK